MTELDHHDRDEPLLALLRDADPARSLAPADPERVARLLEDTMSQSVETPPQVDPDLRATGTRSRSPLTWLVAAAAAVVIAGVGVAGATHLVGRHDSRSSTSSHDLTRPSDTTPAVTALVASSQAGRCAAPTAALLRTLPLAFQATTTAVDGNAVSLTPGTVFAGRVAAKVTLRAPSATLQQVAGAVRFQVGSTYLLAADAQGQVAVCGLSGAATPKLQALYAQAFAG